MIKYHSDFEENVSNQINLNGYRKESSIKDKIQGFILHCYIRGFRTWGFFPSYFPTLRADGGFILSSRDDLKCSSMLIVPKNVRKRFLVQPACYYI